MLELNSVLADRYLVQRHLASGGTADVFGVFDTNLAVHRVIKVAARPTPAIAAEWLRAEREFLEAVRSPFFPSYYDWIEDPPAIVMEYCPGVALEQLPLHPHAATAFGVVRRVCELLAACHAHGFVYRDLKPANVIVPEAANQPWRLIDFGAICRIGAASEAIGTAGFAAPEVVAGAKVDPAADVYSLGRCLTWLTERAPEHRTPLVHAFETALADEDASRRPMASHISQQLEDAWIIEAWTTHGGVCLDCFAPLTHEAPPARECHRVAPSLDLESAREAAARLMRWAQGRGEPGLAAWLNERINGIEALADPERLQLARWHQRAGRKEEALRALSPTEQTSDAPPAQALAPMLLRLVYDVRGPKAAVESIRRSKAHLAANVHWARNAAQVLGNHGSKAEAIELLRMALRAHPNDGPCHALLVPLLPPGRERDDHQRRAASGDPPDADSVRRAAQLLLDAEQGRERAIALAREALAKSPRDASLRRLVADLSIVESRTWPTLEVDLKEWLTDEHDDTLLEFLVDLYVRSERWAQLTSSSLPLPRGPSTRALVSLARTIGRRDPQELPQLDKLAWELAGPSRWLTSVAEALATAARAHEEERARRWLKRLPPSFAPYLEDLESLLVHPGGTEDVRS